MTPKSDALDFLAQRLPVRDLTAEFLKGTLPPFVAPQTAGSAERNDFDSFFVSAARILFRNDRRHLLITGWKGVGKTAALFEFSRLAGAGRFGFLKNHRFLWLDTTHVGPEDSRGCLESILIVARDLRPVVLCIDGIHALIPRQNGGSNKPLICAALQDPAIRIIGVLPRWEYSELFAPDAEMLELFDQLEISEPDEAAAQVIVETAAAALSRRYALSITSQAVRRAVVLTNNFMLRERLPQKAIKVLRQACDDVSFDREERQERGATVDVSHVVTAVSRQTEVPESTLNGHNSDQDWEDALGMAVVGQSRAISAVADELRLIKAGLTDPGKPASVLLFAGMTGVGKTELAKRLAELYSVSHRLQNYSMANFTEPHSVSGIVGVPPGYVGHEQGGRLVNDLQSDPNSVFLLDEAEKAHPNVWKPFLNLFDEGWIVDQRGMKASADRAVFVLTTNAGSTEIQQMARDNCPVEEVEERVAAILARVRPERGAQPVFPPQFLARIKRIIVFQPLDQTAMTQIARKLIDVLCARWRSRRDQELRFGDGVIEWVGAEAHQLNERSGGREGGRSVRKVIASRIERRLTAGALGRGDNASRSSVVTVNLCQGANDLSDVRIDY